MSTDESSSSTARKDEPEETQEGRGASQKSAKKDGPGSASEPLDEKKINAPSRQDLVMLGVICVATLIFWAAGRAACNYQVPGESLTPRRVSLEERTRTPKHVGIEFAQTLSGGDFDIARQLARGEALAFVKKDEQSCGACTERKNASGELLSVGTVLKSNSVDSIVSVRTTGSGTETVRVLGIEREGRKWFVTRIYDSAASAELKPDPTQSQPPPSLERPDELPPTEVPTEEAPKSPAPAPAQSPASP